MLEHLSTRKKEPDELLEFAVVERTVQKFYAFRFRGYTDRIPYAFCKHLEDRGVIGDTMRRQILIFEINGQAVRCEQGDWIVVNEENTEILPDHEFKQRYMYLDELSYE